MNLGLNIQSISRFQTLDQDQDIQVVVILIAINIKKEKRKKKKFNMFTVVDLAVKDLPLKKIKIKEV